MDFIREGKLEDLSVENFEKYINDRASMGAYYTKEDITEYISKNTIIPFLFDKVKAKVKNAFLTFMLASDVLCYFIIKNMQN